MTQPSTAAEIQGWYYRDATGEAVRVRLSVEAGSILLHTLSDRLVASWSLARLKTRATEMVGERWTIGDSSLPEAFLVIESDRDYAALRAVAPRLRPVRARLWKQIGFSAIHAGNITAWPVLVLALGAAAIAWLWDRLSF